MLPLIGLIVFLGVYPEADARPHRAVACDQLIAHVEQHSTTDQPHGRRRRAAAADATDARASDGMPLLAPSGRRRSTRPTSTGTALTPLLDPARRRRWSCSSSARCCPRMASAAATPSSRSSPPAAAIGAGDLRCGTTSPTTAPLPDRRRRARRRRLLAVRHRHDLRRGGPRRAVTDGYLRREGLEGPEVVRPPAAVRRRAAWSWRRPTT